MKTYDVKSDAETPRGWITDTNLLEVSSRAVLVCYTSAKEPLIGFIAHAKLGKAFFLRGEAKCEFLLADTPKGTQFYAVPAAPEEEPNEQYDDDPLVLRGLSLGRSYLSFKSALQKDMDYAWGWHCNLACQGQMAGLSDAEANRMAGSFMKFAFDVDSLNFPPPYQAACLKKVDWSLPIELAEGFKKYEYDSAPEVIQVDGDNALISWKVKNAAKRNCGWYSASGRMWQNKETT